MRCQGKARPLKALGSQKALAVFVAVREGTGEVLLERSFKEFLNFHVGNEEHEDCMRKRSEARMSM